MKRNIFEYLAWVFVNILIFRDFLSILKLIDNNFSEKIIKTDIKMPKIKTLYSAGELNQTLLRAQKLGQRFLNGG